MRACGNYKLRVAASRCGAAPCGDSLPKTVDMASRRSCSTIAVPLLLLLLLELSQPTAAGVMDNVNDGLKLAGQMFGINTAADVANLVAKAFSKVTTTTQTRQKPDLLSVLQQGFQLQQQQEEEENGQDDEQEEEDQYAEEEQQQAEQTEQENAQESPPVAQQGTRRQRPNQFSSVQMLTNMMRMIGFDPRKLGALAINAIVMIAQAVSTWDNPSRTCPKLPTFANRLAARLCKLRVEAVVLLPRDPMHSTSPASISRVHSQPTAAPSIGSSSVQAATHSACCVASWIVNCPSMLWT